MIRGHHRPDWVQAWGEQVRGQAPGLVCVLGFTETALIPGISAAGATPAARRTTAAADAEFLLRGVQPQPVYPLPPLHQGASPVYISHAIVRALNLPVTLVNTGLPVPLSVPAVHLGQTLARCVSTGQAMDLATVHQLWQKGWDWGLLQGLVLQPSAPFQAGDMVQWAIEQGLLLVPAGSQVVRFVPPLIVTEAEVQMALERLGNALRR